MCKSLKALLVGPIWENIVAVVNTQTCAGRALALAQLFLWSKFKIGFTPHLEGWKGTKMLPIDRYLKAEMSEGAIGIRLNISSALRSTVCEGLGP